MSLRDRIRDPEILRVFGVTLAVSIAFGMALSLVAVFLHERGFSKPDIGQVAAWFAGGIVLLSLPMGSFIQRFGARFTLAAAFAGYAITASAFPFLESFPAIAAIRMLDGACSVTVWISTETILLQRSGPGNKAFVTSLYAITMAIGYILGPIVSRALISVFPFYAAFLGAGAIALFFSVYVFLKVDRGPRLDEALGAETVDPEAAAPVVPAGSYLKMLWRIKNSCYATFAFGYFQASVVIFLPIFMVEQKGVPMSNTVLLPTYFAGGMLLFSNIGGRLGDRHGHLGIMRLLASVGMGTILAFVFLDSYVAMSIAVFVAGAAFATISPLSLALQGVVTHRGEYAQANSIYNSFYAAGMLLGPPMSSALFERHGGSAMLYHLAAIWAGFVIFTMVFRRDDPATRRNRQRVPGPVAEQI